MMISLRDVLDMTATEGALAVPPCVAAAMAEGAAPGQCQVARAGDLSRGPDRDLGEAAEELRCLSGVIAQFTWPDGQMLATAKFCQLCKDQCCLYVQSHRVQHE